MKKLLCTLLVVSLIFSACEEEDTTPANSANNNSVLAIGDTHEGGIVFYLDGNGAGLVAAPSDQSTGAVWGCYGIEISGANETSVGSGAQNTIDIEAGCTTTGTAADICANLNLGGYSDWFLPSRNELYEMGLNIGQGNSLGLGNIGNFSDNDYWSSTQNDDNGAWKQNFSNGSGTTSFKNNSKYVRAIRAF